MTRAYIAKPGDYDASEEAYDELLAQELGERVAGAALLENDTEPDWRELTIQARGQRARWIANRNRDVARRGQAFTIRDLKGGTK